MLPFSKPGPINHAEKKALLYAFVFSAVFIVLLGVAAPAKRVTKESATTILRPEPQTKFTESSEPRRVDRLEPLRIAPENFRKVDFKNFSYGAYTISDEKIHTLTLADGQMWDDSGWFNLEDVYYRDITGDGVAEAIVRVLRVRCNGSCDGGSDLFYIYTMRNGKLKNLWRYETGSYADGCGLKSFTLDKKHIVLELFGECAKQPMTDPGPRKFVVEDLTFVLLEFDGHRFLTKEIEYVPAVSRNVKNYEAEIRIY